MQASMAQFAGQIVINAAFAGDPAAMLENQIF